MSDVSQALNGLDKLLEHRVRLAICTLLAQSDAINFSRFKELLAQTDGSLGAQLRKLEDAGYIDIDKQFEERRPVSWYRLTTTGRRSLAKHLDALSALTAGV